MVLHTKKPAQGSLVPALHYFFFAAFFAGFFLPPPP
jgi:hypothetical protein